MLPLAPLSLSQSLSLSASALRRSIFDFKFMISTHLGALETLWRTHNFAINLRGLCPCVPLSRYIIYVCGSLMNSYQLRYMKSNRYHIFATGRRQQYEQYLCDHQLMEKLCHC